MLILHHADTTGPLFPGHNSTDAATTKLPDQRLLTIGGAHTSKQYHLTLIRGEMICCQIGGVVRISKGPKSFAEEETNT